MLVHQTTNSVGEQIYNAFLYKNVCYAPHFHKCYEFVYVLSGKILATIDGTPITLRGGQSLFLSPYQIHSFDESDESVTFIVVFSENYIPRYCSTTASKKAKSPLFVLSENVKNFALSVMMPDTELTEPTVQLPEPNILEAKAALYAVCSDFFNQATFIDSSEQENTLTLKCLRYIEENYQSDISLESMSKAIGYNPEYLSRIFNKGLGIHFKTMVNQYRVEKARRMITDTKESMTTIALECGFQSLRTFNRAFTDLVNKTPSALRGNH